MTKTPLTLTSLLLLLLSLTPIVSAAGNYYYHGVVQDEDGDPIAGTTVQVYDLRKIREEQGHTGPPETTFLTNADGSFTTNLYRAYDYKLVFEKNGYTKQTRIVESSSSIDVDLGFITLERTLILDLPSAQRTTQPGTRLTIPFQISNQGERDETITLIASCSQPWTTEIRDDLGEINGVNLRAGSSQTLDLVVEVAMTLEEADVTLSVSGYITVSKTLTITPVDEELEFLYCPYPSKQGWRGGVVDFRVSVRNPYHQIHEFDLTVKELSQGWTGYLLNDLGERVTSVNVPGEDAIDVTLRVEIPETAQEGTYGFEVETAHGELFDSTQLRVNVEDRVSAPCVRTRYPTQSVELGESASFPVILENPTQNDEVFTLSLEGLLPGWRGGFTVKGGANVQSVLVEAGCEEMVTAVFTPPILEELEDYVFKAVVESPNLRGEQDLTVSLIEQTARLLGLDVWTRYPVLKVEQGNEASFPITMENPGETDEVLRLSVEDLPEGWRCNFVNEEGSYVQSVLLEAGGKERVSVVLQPSMYAVLQSYEIRFKVESLNLNEELDLTVGLLGKIEMKIKLVNLYERLVMGREKVIEICVANTGYSYLTLVKLDVVSPLESLEVECKPIMIETIPSGEEEVFELTVTALEGTAQGDYILEMKALSRELETESVQMRLTVAASGNQTLIAGVVVAAAFASVLLVYRKFKRK